MSLLVFIQMKRNTFGRACDLGNNYRTNLFQSQMKIKIQTLYAKVLIVCILYTLVYLTKSYIIYIPRFTILIKIFDFLQSLVHNILYKIIYAIASCNSSILIARLYKKIYLCEANIKAWLIGLASYWSQATGIV